MSTGVAATTKPRRTDLQAVDSRPDAQVATIRRDEVERRAYERFIERGSSHGADVDDWLEAERELLASRQTEG